MYYKIGQIAKMMGVSPHLLKHYEKFDLIQPVKNEDSNYRYYDISQCARVIECKKYRNMGFSLQEIKEILSQDSYGIENRLENRIEELQQEIEKLNFMKLLSDEYLQECRYIENNIDNWFIEVMEDSYFLQQSSDQMILEHNSCLNNEFNLIENVPICKSMMHVTKDSAMEGGYRHEWGLWIEKSKLNRLQPVQKGEMFEQYKDFIHLPTQKVFVAYLNMEIPYLNNQVLFQKIYQLYHEFRQDEPKECYSIVIKTTVSNGITHQYLKVFIPLS